MVYKKTYRRKRAYRKKKTNYTVGGSVAHLAKRAMQGVKFIKDIINVEYKYFDVAVIPTDIDYNGYVGNLCNPGQGTTAITRNGDSIKLISVDIGGTFYKGSSQTLTIPVRFMLIQGIDERTTPPTGATILQSAGTYQAINSPRHVDYTTFYKVIWDYRTKITPSANDPNSMQHFEHFEKLDHHIKFVTGSTNVESGGIYFCVVSDNSDVGTNVPQIALYSRVRYVDN